MWFFKMLAVNKILVKYVFYLNQESKTCHRAILFLGPGQIFYLWICQDHARFGETWRNFCSREQLSNWLFWNMSETPHTVFFPDMNQNVDAAGPSWKSVLGARTYNRVGYGAERQPCYMLRWWENLRRDLQGLYWGYFRPRLLCKTVECRCQGGRGFESFKKLYSIF